MINLGLFLTAAGIYLFKAPNKFATGGVSGLAIIFEKFFPNVSIGALMLAINILLIIISFIFLGFQFTSNSIYSSIILSFFVWAMDKIHPINESLTGDTFLELIFGITLPAIGSAIVFNKNSSTGGTDIVAKILVKKTSLHIGKTLLITDFIITVFAGVAYGLRIGLYSILGVLIKGFLVDIVIESINISKQMMIVSGKHEEIKKYIIEQLKRDATVYRAYGAFTNEEKDVICTVLSRRQAVRLKNFIKEIDKKAFIYITNTSEIIGKGFRNSEV